MFINKIVNTMEAFQLYVNLQQATESEEALLKSKFEGKLPTAERELEEGKIVIERKLI